MRLKKERVKGTYSREIRDSEPQLRESRKQTSHIFGLGAIRIFVIRMEKDEVEPSENTRCGNVSVIGKDVVIDGAQYGSLLRIRLQDINSGGLKT